MPHDASQTKAQPIHWDICEEINNLKHSIDSFENLIDILFGNDTPKEKLKEDSSVLPFIPFQHSLVDSLRNLNGRISDYTLKLQEGLNIY